VSWPTIPNRQIDMEVIPPTSDVVDRIVELTPSAIIANLAAAGTLDVLARLRAAGCCGEFWGCLAAPDADEVVMLGPVEPGKRPVDVDVVLEWVLGCAPKGTRILVADGNVNSCISLRAALVRAGMSVATAWDVRQVLDVSAMVRPQVVIVDVDLPPHGSQQAVMHFGSVNPVPTVMLIPSAADPAAGFLRLLGEAGEDLERVSRATCLARFQGA
jgi:CheY-like chemotaxis protein